MHDDLEQSLLDHVYAATYQPVKPKVIAKKLGLPKDRHRELRQALKRLVKKGRLTYGSSHLVKPVKPGHRAPEITGYYHRAAGGFGFVRPTGNLAVGANQQDIYIPRRRSMDAAHGDLVRVRLRGRGRREDESRERGEVIEVLERETYRFVGTYDEKVATGLVQIDGNVFADPIPVGDPGAKGVRAGDKVVIEMVRFPSHVHEGEGVVVEVLGPQGDPGVDTLTVIREFDLPEAFSEDVLEAARAAGEAFDESLGEDRLDYTGVTVVTIDPIDARDFDDAISLDQLENGHWQLGVHIADVSHFVPADSELDREARQRATSIYLPDRVIPMLPEVISNNLASLQPKRLRYAMSVMIEFTADGAPVTTDVRRTAIRSDRRFTYEEVDQYIEDPQAWVTMLPNAVYLLVGRMHRLAMILRKRRLEGGSIELTLPEVKIELDRDGRVTGANLVEQTESHQVIEEFMLAANEAVARMLNDRQVDFLRRIHDPPDPRKLKLLTEFVRELGISCEGLESRFEIKRVIGKVQGEPLEYAVNYAVLRSMRKAVYGPQDSGHYALHSTHYCHFTSPIRRYPDLTVHRIIGDMLAGTQPAESFMELAILGDHCSEREQRAEAAERALVKLKLLIYLRERIGTQLDAVITGVERYGVFAQGVQLPAEGLIHISSMQDDYYHYDSDTHTLEGRKEGNRLRLGDQVRVEVAHVDLDRRELDFRLVERVSSSASATARRGTRREKKVGAQGKSGSNKKGKAKTMRKGKGKKAKGKGKKKTRR